MPTLKQRKAVKLVESSRTFGEALVKAGYSKNTAIKPSQVTNSVGFKELCDEAGLTDKFLTSALVEDIKLKPQNRKAELELGFKVKGLLREDADKGDKTITINLINLESYGGNDSPPLRATIIPDTVHQEQKEIQDSDTSSPGREKQDSVKLANLESL